MLLIKNPILTEKTMALAEEQNKYTFEVATAATKSSARKELEKLFGVTVKSIRSQNRLGKTYKYGKYRRSVGRKPAKKIMVFELNSGDKIDAFTS